MKSNTNIVIRFLQAYSDMIKIYCCFFLIIKLPKHNDLKDDGRLCNCQAK